MPSKIIIESDELNEDCKGEFRHEFKDEFKRVLKHGPFGSEKIRKHIHIFMENEVKLFTDKAEMVTFVNQLSDIQNVEIFKIEDQLYKVLVSRRKKHEKCCEEEKE